MKITLNWIRNHVDFDGSPDELAERLTMLGLEVESMQRLGGDLDGIVVAQVLSREKHPNADKLSVCRVSDGSGERQIVCGAQNFQAGDKVPLIIPGASLPSKPGDREPFTIKVGKIRGVESHGMLCSAAELGIRPEDIAHRAEDGLLILHPDAVVGQPFTGYLGREASDVVYDMEITPNRPDWNSVIGIAREIAAVTRRELKIPAATLDEAPEPVSGVVEVQIDAPDLCPRYTARVVRGVTIGPSPDWLRIALEKAGVRSINNVVDVSNFVMLETGQPLHAFDLRQVAAGPSGVPRIIVRRAQDGEVFTTLDGVRHSLGADHLLIADAEKGIALAGVMGGANSEISASTVDVLVESATFSATQIRRTSKALGLRTDASYRFERGADIGICEYASRRCAELIAKTAGGTPMSGVVDVQPAPVLPRSIPLRFRRTGEVLGVEIPPEEQTGFLVRLGLEVSTGASDATASEASFRVPTWRVDLKREVDLIEEIARLHGVDRIPSTPPRGAVGAHPFDAIHDEMSDVRGRLVSLGLIEAQGQTLINDVAARRITDDIIRLANPLSSDMNVLRPSLLPGLLDTLQHNLTRRNGDLQLFEVGRVFSGREGAAPKEGWRVALALTGARCPAFWSGAERDARCDLYDLKGLLEELLDSMGLRGVVWTPNPSPSDLFLESASVTLGGKLVLGRFGQVQPAVARRHDLRDPVLMAELDLDLLLARRNRSKGFKPLPQFPSSQRDIAMIVPEAVTHDAVLGVVRKVQPPHLERVELFDVFRGRHVADGFKSMAYSFTFRAPDRTLKEDEVNATNATLVEAFKTSLQAAIRE